MAYNTEHRKCHRTSPQDLGADTNDESEDEQAALQTTPSEEDLLEMMHFAQVKTLQAICRNHGATGSSRMSKAECISYLRTKLGIPENFRKIFSKIWGASGKYTTLLRWHDN
ncbi:uncharacterized protein LOC110052228 [Orbicella faveolata]|uniref:uncharacterized protein LOC110052228 n=1 Tax=Orbicella faveolata TaxID=48498 RepID=UPI0009E197BC|nr:uncharacterized protein LOC110052228 [Orbicella faveolata]